MKTKTQNKIYEYPVNASHSTVLGYATTSIAGKGLWDELDWRGVREDGGSHIFNPAGGGYLHVRVMPEKYERLLCERRWYRVRCCHRIGSKWRGGVVADVRVKKRGKKWIWIVDVEQSEVPMNPMDP